MLTDRQIVLEILLVNTPKGSQKVPDRRPQALNGIDMDFPDPIPIVIPCPFPHAMTDGAVRAVNARIALPLISIAPGLTARVAMDMGLQRRPVRVLAHAQPTPSRASSNRTNHRRPIILIGAVPRALVGPSPWRIGGVGVPLTFFPPHSGTSHLSRSRYPSTLPLLTTYSHWLAPSAVGCGPFSDTPPVPQLGWHCSRPCTRRAPAARLGGPTTHSPQRLSRCKDCRPDRNTCSGNRRSPAWSGETPVPARCWSYSTDSETPADGNSARPSGCSLRRPTTQ